MTPGRPLTTNCRMTSEPEPCGPLSACVSSSPCRARKGERGGELASGHESALPSGIKQTFLSTSLASQVFAFEQPDPTFGNVSSAFQGLCHIRELSDSLRLSENEVAMMQPGDGCR